MVAAICQQAPANTGAAASHPLCRFFNYVLPALDEYWLRHSVAVSYLEAMYEQRQSRHLGCGPTAFAALLGVRENELSSFFPDIEDRFWVSRRDMDYALREHGCIFNKTHRAWPIFGLC